MLSENNKKVLKCRLDHLICLEMSVQEPQIRPPRAEVNQRKWKLYLKKDVSSKFSVSEKHTS